MPPDQCRSTEAIKIRFEPFELNVLEGSLKKAGETAPLAGQAFDLLLGLIERSSETVGKVLGMETGAQFSRHLTLSGSYA